MSRLNISFGLSGSVLDWFKSYLIDRQQRAKHNGVLSDSVPLRYGVPQGSVLRPVLFLMYRADVEGIVQRHNLLYHGYADDQQTYGSCKPTATETQALRTQATECIAE